MAKWNACEGDDALRREVELLLRFEGGSISAETATKSLAPRALRPPARVSIRDGTCRADTASLNVSKRGASAKIYHAEDLAFDEAIALKFSVRKPPGIDTPENDFEMRSALPGRSLAPCLPRLRFLGEIEGLSFISMEYIRGEDLQSLLRRIGRLPPDRGIEVAVQLASGLAAAHHQGVLHRDLKPANVMLDERGQVRITDFGLASIAGSIESKDIRSGTPAYMAPEQLTEASRSPSGAIFIVWGWCSTSFSPVNLRLGDPPDPGKVSRPVPPSSLVNGMDPRY